MLGASLGLVRSSRPLSPPRARSQGGITLGPEQGELGGGQIAVILTFVVIGDDGLDHRKLPRDEHLDKERIFIHSNSPSFQSCS